MTDTLTPHPAARAPLAPPVATARRLAAAALAPTTLAAYAAALRALDRWLAGRALTDASLAAYLAHVFESGRAVSTAAQAVKAANYWATLARQPRPAGDRTAAVLAGYRRTAADRGRGQAAPFTADDLAAVLATCPHPRRSGRGTESAASAAARGRVDGVIAGLLFMAGMRRSEVSAVEWRDVTDATDGAGVLVAVRQSKTNPDGDTADLRYLKNEAARAVRTLRAHLTPAGATSPAPTARVVPFTGQRFTAAAAAAGLARRVTAHSGRVGLASELTARGASTTAVMLAGNWKTARMVAHYSAGAARLRKQ